MTYDRSLCQHITFNSYFRQNYRTLCFFALQYLQDYGKAEDAVQGVFLNILENGMTFRDEEHLRRWLYVAVRNSCLNHVKRAGILSRVMENIRQETRSEDESGFIGPIVRAEMYHLIVRAIEGLPSECGRIFRMAYLEELDNETIASQLGLSVNTVKSQKHKAKLLLRESLKDIFPAVLYFVAGAGRHLF